MSKNKGKKKKNQQNNNIQYNKENNELHESTQYNKKKSIQIHRIITTITLMISIAYLSYYIITTDSIVTNLSNILTPIFIFIISFVLFVASLNTSTNNKMYVFISIILIAFMSANILIDRNIVKLPEDKKMISFINKPYEELNTWAKSNNIELVMEYEFSDTIPKGNIIRTDFLEGALVKDINKITVTISDGPDYDKLIIIPSMLGWNVDDVVSYINDNFLNNVIINYEENDSEKDIIFKQNKNGEIRRNEELILTASIGSLDEISETINVIDLKGKTLFEALLWLKRNNIKYELKYEFNDKDKDIVLNQSIENKEIKVKDDTLILTVSKGKSIKIPDFTKMNVNEATEWIIKNNLKVKFDELYDESIETGKIIKQDIEANKEVESGVLITLTISKGQIKMQKFNNLYEFKEWANKYNVLYNESYEYSDTVSKGNVISYSYKENETVDPDSVIYVKVSLGKAISIPSFVGKTKSEAQTTCNNLGIRCSFTSGNYNNNYDVNVIYAQSRNVGTKVASGSSITLTLSKGKPTTFKLSILQNEFSIGNADATISNLRNVLSSRYPGVNFTFQKVKDNSLNSGLISPNSPTKIGASIKQGNTYTIYIVSN